MAAPAAALTPLHVSRQGPLQLSSLEGFLDRVRENNGNLEAVATLTPFLVHGRAVGQLKPEFVEHLRRFPGVFDVRGQPGPSGAVHLSPTLATLQQGNAAVAGVLDQLRAEGVITGWRDELYPVTSSFYSEPVLLVERAAATYFGIKAYGIHCNGYVVAPDGSMSLWVARRSKTKPNWPGKLDHIVAGGQPHGLGVRENVLKECEEEAGINAELASTARPVGAVSYTTVSATGYKPDVLFVWDLQLPTDFVPKPQDGEVEEFMLWPVQRVAETVLTSNEFKQNCNLVIIDFFIRHGLVPPELPGYLELCQSLRSGDCS